MSAPDPDRLRRRREHLMSELTLDAPETRAPARPRRTARRMVAAFACAAVLTGGAFVALSAGGDGGGGGTAFAVQRISADTVSVRVVDSEVSAKAMTQQLRAAGIDVKVETMAASSQLVGTWVYVGGSGDVPDSVLGPVVEQAMGYTATLELPASFPGSLVLGVGRRPHKGEQVGVSGARNALAPGGLLYCTRLPGTPVAQAVRRLRDDGWTVRWTRGKEPLPGSLVAAVFVSDTERVVEVTAAPYYDTTYIHASWLGYAPSMRERNDRGYATSCPEG